MKNFLSFTFFIISTILSAQNNDAEYYRLQGNQSRLEGDYSKAISLYKIVLYMDTEDYDAKLALARLFQKTGATDSAMLYFQRIFTNDSTDVEALNGMGECYLIAGKYKHARSLFQKALSYLPDNIPVMLNLAKAYGYDGQQDMAISIYLKINTIDPTWSEVWAGIGKMYYWKGKPATAAIYYEKALELDATNEEIRKEYVTIQEELKFAIGLKIRPVTEREEYYEINAITSSLKVEKRLGNYFHVDANFLMDNSDRTTASNIADTTRKYNNGWIKGSLLLENNKISFYGGYSGTDSKVTPLGMSWMINRSIGKFNLRNTLTAGYDYFYYWNKVGAKSLNENFTIGYGKFKINATYSKGIVDAVLVKDVQNDTAFVSENDYNSYGVSLSCKVFSKPDITISLAHSYIDYQYKSPLYYSPFGRKLSGAAVTFYHSMKGFFLYGNYSYNLGSEYYYEIVDDAYQQVDLDVDNWSFDAEAGYKYKFISLSVGISQFYNPYYRSNSFFTNLKVMF